MFLRSPFTLTMVITGELLAFDVIEYVFSKKRLIISFWSIYLLQKNVQQDFHEENSLTDFQRRLPENTFQSIKLLDR